MICCVLNECNSMNACVGANMSSRLTCLCINELTKRLKGKILSGEKKFNFETH